MVDVKISSPNERSFGVGPGMMKNVGEGLCGTVVGVAVTALGVGYSVGQYAGGASFVATLGMVGVSAISGVAIGVIVLQCIMER